MSHAIMTNSEAATALPVQLPVITLSERLDITISCSVDCTLHTHTFNGPFSGTTRVSRYQKGKTNLDFTGARDIEWQWHQLGHMQICTSLQTDNHAHCTILYFFYKIIIMKLKEHRSNDC